MGLVEKNREPTPFELRIFGQIVAALGGLIGWLTLYRFELTIVASVIWVATLAMVALYYALPGIRRTIYFAWMTIFYPLGWLISHALLALVYYLVLTPIGLAVRLFGHNPLERSFDPSANSYWKPRAPNRDPSHYFKQY
jgi:MFS family permease